MLNHTPKRSTAKSQLMRHLPEPVLEAQNLRVGDAIVFEIDSAFTKAVQGALSEWDSVADDEAYADL